jgi:hypothetical protein
VALGKIFRGGYVIANFKKHGVLNLLIFSALTVICITLFFFLCDFLIKLFFKIEYFNIIKTKTIDFVKVNKKIVYVISALIITYFIIYLYYNKELLPVVVIPFLMILVSFYFYYIIKNAFDQDAT